MVYSFCSSSNYPHPTVMWFSRKINVEDTSDASALKLHHQLNLPSLTTRIPFYATAWCTSFLTSFRKVCCVESRFYGKQIQTVTDGITALRQFLSANTTSLDEKALFDSTISCFDTSIPRKILQGFIWLDGSVLENALFEERQKSPQDRSIFWFMFRTNPAG